MSEQKSRNTQILPSPSAPPRLSPAPPHHGPSMAAIITRQRYRPRKRFFGEKPQIKLQEQRGKTASRRRCTEEQRLEDNADRKRTPRRHLSAAPTPPAPSNNHTSRVVSRVTTKGNQQGDQHNRSAPLRASSPRVIRLPRRAPSANAADIGTRFENQVVVSRRVKPAPDEPQIPKCADLGLGEGCSSAAPSRAARRTLRRRRIAENSARKSAGNRRLPGAIHLRVDEHSAIKNVTDILPSKFRTTSCCARYSTLIIDGRTRRSLNIDCPRLP